MSSKIYIVGMGPGTGDMMTPQADHALCGSDVIVGYPVYLKLLGGKYREKEFLSTPMKQEVRRCEMCFEEAEKGKRLRWYAVGMQACMEWHPCSMRCRKRIRDVNLR